MVIGIFGFTVYNITMFCRTFRLKQGRLKKYVNMLTIIEELRCELNYLGSVKMLTDPELLNLSRRLDMLVNLFMRSEAGSKQTLGYRYAMSSLEKVK